MEDLVQRWRESEEYSRRRRAANRTRKRRSIAQVGFTVVAGAALAAAAIFAAPNGAAGDRMEPTTGSGVPAAIPIGDRFTLEPPASAARERRRRKPPLVPEAAALRVAAKYGEERGGLVSFAVVDSEGHLRGHDVEHLYSAASVVKAMVLAAELRRLAGSRSEIDETTGSLLRAMITYSDNEAADAVYARVGDAGMHEVAKRAGMTGFTIAGHWGNAQITAADMARFFGDLDRMLPRRFREYGQSLLGSVIPSQSWGIPVAAGDRWGVRFKGGWLPDHALIHQAAELRERGGPRQISMAILTDEQPSHAYGVETLEGVAARLLAEN